jgi:hypothetical protein
LSQSQPKQTARAGTNFRENPGSQQLHLSIFTKLFVRIASMSIDFPKEEEAIIARWREIKAFERQVRIPLT